MMNKVLEVSSAANAVFKKYLSLTKSAGLKEHKLFLLSGEDQIAEYMKARTKLELVTEIRTAKQAAVSKASQLVLSSELFKEIDVLGTHHPVLVIAQPEIKKYLPEEPKGLELVLPLGDPSNLGACLRSAEAFGVQKVILTVEAANPFLPKSVKASAGSVWRVPLYKGESIQSFGEQEVGLSLNGKPIRTHSWALNSRLVVGEEGPGLEKIKFFTGLKIETAGVESLNATVSASLALFSYRLQHPLK